MATHIPRGTAQLDVNAAVAEQTPAAEALSTWRTPSEQAATARPLFTLYPFSLGVASGSPLPTSVVLWTRLAPEPLNGGGAGTQPIVVSGEVADTETFGRVVQRGSVEAVAEQGHSVHVEVEGLEPAHWYFYRFLAGDEVSPVGRTRTAPAVADDVQQLRCAFGSCQHFEQGYYAAHRHLLAEDLDLMVFLGDYIYEADTGPAVARVRRHAGAEPRTLVEYRNRHGQYKTDPDLQRLHAAVPWLVTWDDHEVDNDYAARRSETLEPDFARRRTAAYRAYFEHMPLRGIARPTASGAMLLRARYDFGRLARFHVLDGRQRRSPQACPRRGRGGSNVVDERCRELFDPTRTMLGPLQEQWLADGLRDAPVRWHVIAQQTLMARAARTVGGRRSFSNDPWDGYPIARERLFRSITDHDVRSCLVMSGDAHTTYVSDLKADFDDDGAPAIATELCGTSIATHGPAQSHVDAIVSENPHIRYGDGTRRGYIVLDITPQGATARLRVLDDVQDRNTGVGTAATFAIEPDRPGAQPV
jgi:alkaline phosphatase D